MLKDPEGPLGLNGEDVLLFIAVRKSQAVPTKHGDAWKRAAM